jgi:hypothetical protein
MPLMLCICMVQDCGRGIIERLARLMRVLVQHGAPLEARCKEGYTAAALAALAGLNSALIVLHGEVSMATTLLQRRTSAGALVECGC